MSSDKKEFYKRNLHADLSILAKAAQILTLLKGRWDDKAEEIEAAYFSLHDEYSEATNGSDKMEKLWVLMNLRIEARIKVGLGDKSQMNWVNAYTIDIEELMKPDENYDPVKSRMKVQKVYGLPIKPKEITVYEYLMICKVVEEEATAKNSLSNGKGKE